MSFILHQWNQLWCGGGLMLVIDKVHCSTSQKCSWYNLLRNELVRWESTSNAVNCTADEDEAPQLSLGRMKKDSLLFCILKDCCVNLKEKNKLKISFCSCECRHADFFRDYCHWRNIPASFDYLYNLQIIYLKIIYLNEGMNEKVALEINYFLHLLFVHLNSAWTSW